MLNLLKSPNKKNINNKSKSIFKKLIFSIVLTIWYVKKPIVQWLEHTAHNGKNVGSTPTRFI